MKTKLTACIALILAIMSSVVLAKDPHKAPNNSWISLSGIVVTAGVSSFEMDYGKGIVTVELDDWDWYKEVHPILSGDRVTVYGYIDDDQFERTSIEASSVFLKDLNTYYYANNDDEEDVRPTSLNNNSLTVNGLQLRGRVTGVDGRRFTIDTGKRKMEIDTVEMFYNPLDDKGYQKIKVGDHVEVTGKLNSNVLRKAELMAETVTTLVKDKSKKNR